MKRTIYLLFFVFSICSALTGCKNVFLGLYGMRMPKEVNEKKILRYGIFCNCSLEPVYGKANKEIDPLCSK